MLRKNYISDDWMHHKHQLLVKLDVSLEDFKEVLIINNIFLTLIKSSSIILPFGGWYAMIVGFRRM